MHCTTSSGSRLFLLQTDFMYNVTFLVRVFFDYEFAILSVFVSHFFRLCIVSFIKKNNGMPNELSRDQPS